LPGGHAPKANFYDNDLSLKVVGRRRAFGKKKRRPKTSQCALIKTWEFNHAFEQKDLARLDGIARRVDDDEHTGSRAATTSETQHPLHHGR
jgi:hypothetical protein